MQFIVVKFDLQARGGGIAPTTPPNVLEPVPPGPPPPTTLRLMNVLPRPNGFDILSIVMLDYMNHPIVITDESAPGASDNSVDNMSTDNSFESEGSSGSPHQTPR